ncbi:root hair specific 17 isoform X1 [Zea mays]|uniref:O-fucosyltransferase family protein n=3 Tax=Zea mays TaxID=4577 RepID=B6U0Q1_MAIZE|nr:root hair specific 17 isoform X1 [Zea mays]XP_008647313.1 root hair specific 17 isoform X1 [Zea mays]XP_008647314.1 root hair specific 17 isoform X1 [Zea mays]XP_008647315.1 root hair specific 17 isoform X1 [Zea mays]XP_035815258.1 root hair specific 17 isoform X1 [Zea mays]XP_035815259.1 root hair specific 17 isoform X1 [Zea mays]XP_035815260.1 root hair specific 17 isoform X1 [Zea mays]ACG42934.1 growth regulator like protein [Zea mays]AQK88771.1 root hair specific 17 [Zea mays]AQK887|eukprot:XP_008647312.1 root hair specific 17 isoform X1 [Zea mays]
MRRALGRETLLRRHRGSALLWLAVTALVTGTICLWSSFSVGLLSTYRVQDVVANELWRTVDSNGWRASSAPRICWPPPPAESESNGYLRVWCNGGLTQQRSAICNAVVVARIMNATLVLPELDTNSFWHDESGFVDIYDVPHFINTLKYDVRIVMSIPKITAQGKTKKLKAYKILPPRDAPVTWYRTTALERLRKYGAIYLTPFSHRLAEKIDDPEFQRLRCRVNYHALRFKPSIMKTSSDIANKLHSEGHFMSIHLRFELDVLAYAGCFDIFTPEEQEILLRHRNKYFPLLLRYWGKYFPGNTPDYRERRLIGKCPLTPEEVGLILRATGFDNSTWIYLAPGKLFGGKHFMKPFKAMFPRLKNHSMIRSGKLEENIRGLAGSAVDYMVCLLSDIFIYDGPSNFADNLMGHRLYYGFRTTITPNKKALARIFMDREEGHTSAFEERVRQVMLTHFGAPHKRIHPESFYTNPWPECFCQTKARNHADRCPHNSVNDVLESWFHNKEDVEVEATNQTDSTS